MLTDVQTPFLGTPLLPFKQEVESLEVTYDDKQGWSFDGRAVAKDGFCSRGLFKRQASCFAPISNVSNYERSKVLLSSSCADASLTNAVKDHPFLMKRLLEEVI